MDVHGTNRVTLEVHSPVSHVDILCQNASRLDSLNGKALCTLWVSGNWAGERTFPVLGELLLQRFPNLTVIPNLDIFAADGTGNDNSSLISRMRRKVTAVINEYKPKNWSQLLVAAREELQLNTL